MLHLLQAKRNVHGHYGSEECEMNKKQNVIEICMYILIIILLIFGVGKIHKNEPQKVTVPSVEMPQQTERVQ